jgi:phosphoribosylamine---glycine ligase
MINFPCYRPSSRLGREMLPGGTRDSSESERDADMRILVVGSGGREHAIVWKLMQSSGVKALMCAPGNGGISKMTPCVAVEATDAEGIVRLCKKERIELVVVGPESALAAGVVDEVEKAGIMAFGPTRSGARIETSKVFAKTLMESAGIPTAPFKIFTEYQAAANHIATVSPPFVVKADGLCAGKGAFVVHDLKEGTSALKELLVDRTYGDAGRHTIVEDFLSGIEVSYLAFSDGHSILPMTPSQDHKTLLDQDRGPNTGGMGAYAPVPFFSPNDAARTDQLVMRKTVEAMATAGVTYKGVLYAGLMVSGGESYVLEFNARFGDPETQPILFRMESDLLPILVACAEGTLHNIQPISWKNGVSLCLVLASQGYPENPVKGQLIRGLEDLENRDDLFVFHAGTRRESDRYYTSGGRVLGLTVLGSDYADAISKAYAAVSSIHFNGMQYRKDIGAKALGLTSAGR